MFDNYLVVSIVSHGHGQMVSNLANKLSKIKEINKIYVTKNIPEDLEIIESNKITVIDNFSPLGFGKNHNNIFFNFSKNYKYFCILNPDIDFFGNPFIELIRIMEEKNASLAAPLVLGKNGFPEDSVRYFPTFASLLNKLIFKRSGSYKLNSITFYPEWVAGMFMLFDSKDFSNINGFDTGYYLYYEDADICVRFWRAGFKIIACPSVSIIHYAQRTSHRSFKFAKWHLMSMFRFLIKYYKNLPIIENIN